MANNINNKKFMITCKEAAILTVQKADIILSLSDRMRLFMHLLVCRYCRLFDKQSEIIDKLLSNWKTDKKLTMDQKTTLQSVIEKELK